VINHRQVPKKTLESIRIGGIEGRGAQCTNLGCSVIEMLGITRGENHPCPLCACAVRSLKADPGAPADDHDSLLQ
jgi:hypothetical protein